MQLSLSFAGGVLAILGSATSLSFHAHCSEPHLMLSYFWPVARVNANNPLVVEDTLTGIRGDL